MPTPRRPPVRYRALMNARYDRIREATGSDIVLKYDGDWTATTSRPKRQGSGATVGAALDELERAIGLEVWTG
jgi:hypothetical protein